MTTVLPPPGDTPAERVANFLALYPSATLQYTYPPLQEPSEFKQYNLATSDVATLLREHQRMLRTLQDLRVRRDVDRLLAQDHV